nr:ribosomal protein L6 [Blastocystis sp. subtype 8]
MFYFQLSNYKNFRIILTTKYLILITQNGILKFTTNIFQLYITRKQILINLYKLNQQFYLKFYKNYLKDFYQAFYFMQFLPTMTLTIKGVGYKFILENELLKIRIGYSHFIEYSLPFNVYITLISPTTLICYSNNLLFLTQFLAFIKHQKKLNIYKGTGIFYSNEILRLKKKNTNKNKNVK